MTEKRWLYFALGVTTVISLGAVTNQLVPLAPASGVALSETGITFPDGTEQTTAAMDAASTARSNKLDSCTVYLTDGEQVESCSFDEVPAGKILVVEFVSGQLGVPGGQGVEIHFVQSHPSGSFLQHKLLHRYQYTDSGGDNEYIVSQLVRLYVDEANALHVRVTRNTSTGDNIWGDFWMTGYYVDRLP